MNPFIIIHGMHQNKLTRQLEVDYEIIIPRSNGESRERGTAKVGQKIEIEINEHTKDITTD